MSEDLFARLKRRSSTSANSSYGFSKDANSRSAADRFSARPGVQPSAPSSNVDRRAGQTQQKQQQKQRKSSPWDDTDRPPAYYPPEVHDPDSVNEWKPPSKRRILKDLGWRLVEAILGASGEAFGSEIAYFFRRRRFGLGKKFRRK